VAITSEEEERNCFVRRTRNCFVNYTNKLNRNRSAQFLHLLKLENLCLGINFQNDTYPERVLRKLSFLKVNISLARDGLLNE
jgi:hypothetical protein